MSKVTLSNGKSFEANWAGASLSGETFAANFSGVTLLELALAFSDQTEITVEAPDFEPVTYTGYSRISELRTMPDGSVNMILRRDGA